MNPLTYVALLALVRGVGLPSVPKPKEGVREVRHYEPERFHLTEWSHSDIVHRGSLVRFTVRVGDFTATKGEGVSWEPEEEVGSWGKVRGRRRK